MESVTKTRIIDDIRSITGDAVAKKQEAAKLNFPKIIEKIKKTAEIGESHIYLSEYEVNTFDKELLEKEGFSVWYTDMPTPKWAVDAYKAQYLDGKQKGWKISW